MMKRYTFITFIDITAFIGFVFMMTTGVLMRYVLPPRSGRFVEIFGLNRHEWGDIHLYISFIFLGVLSVHLFLHWRFIFRIFTGHGHSILNYRFILGLFALIAFLALAIAPLVAPLESTGDTTGHHYGRER